MSSSRRWLAALFFFFNDTATTEIYTLSLHDALPISHHGHDEHERADRAKPTADHGCEKLTRSVGGRSEEHTSELQSQSNLVCRLLLEKKKRSRSVRQQSGPAHAHRLRVPLLGASGYV